MPFGAAIRSQQMIGGMERCLDYALTYANERVQFGRPIAKLQAVQHMLAIAAGHFAAATAAADAPPNPNALADDRFAVAIAKSRCGEAAGQVAAVCQQVHGAMGFTQEHPLHFASRRLWSWRDEWGAETYWQEMIGRAICAVGGRRFSAAAGRPKADIKPGGAITQVEGPLDDVVEQGDHLLLVRVMSSRMPETVTVSARLCPSILSGSERRSTGIRA